MRQLLYAAVLLIIINTADANVLAQRHLFKLTQADINYMILAGEQIAQQPFTQQERVSLKQSAIALFKQAKDPKAVKQLFILYQRYYQLFQKHSNAAIQRLIWHHLYREMVFKRLLPNDQHHLITWLGVIQRYNPIVEKLEQEKMMRSRKDRLLSRKGKYFFTESMRSSLDVVATFLSHRQLPSSAFNALHQWSIVDFQQSPKSAMNSYAYFLNEVVPMALSPAYLKKQRQYRLNTYSHLYFSFRQDLLAQRWQGDLMDIVTYYNPMVAIDEQQQIISTRYGSSQPKKQQKLLENQLLLQNMQTNQQLFNQMMGQFQHSNNEMNQSMQAFSTRQSIQLSGGQIINNQNDRYIVEDNNGEHYEAIK